MRKNTVDYIPFLALMLLAVFITNGVGGFILLNLVDDDDDGPAIQSVTFKDGHQLLPSLEKIQHLPQSTFHLPIVFQLPVVSPRKVTFPVSTVQDPFPLSTRD